MMDWEEAICEFKAYLLFEKSLSANSIEAYLRDVGELYSFSFEKNLLPQEVLKETIEAFIVASYDKGKERSSQARLLSGIRSFYGFLLLSDEITESPVELISSPKQVRRLPDTLSQEEVDRLIESVDLSKPLGHRNQAILEVLYSCGLRVSELTNLRLTDMFFNDGFIRVIGKGNKQRLIPVSDEVIRQVGIYLKQRSTMPQIKGEGDYLFLNRRGKHLTRVMIFHIIKAQAVEAGIQKNISPHTLRHSFATHLIKGGANIRVVQDMLGHESIITTEIYTHLDTKYKREAMESFHPLSKGNS